MTRGKDESLDNDDSDDNDIHGDGDGDLESNLLGNYVDSTCNWDDVYMDDKDNNENN